MLAAAVAGPMAFVACSRAVPPMGEGKMAASDAAQQTPYDITPRVWRDEQPGDEPRLLVSATFAPRPSAERWQDVRLRTLEIHANEQRWKPIESSLAPLGEGGFEIKASGEATLPAGTKATIVVTLQTSSGEKQLALPTEIGRVA